VRLARSRAADGKCDDGGPNSISSICNPGTDCTDCGPRTTKACSPMCFDFMWDDRKCDKGCNTFECSHNDCTELEIIEHCLQGVPTLMRQSEAVAGLGAAAASMAAGRVQDVALQVELEPFNVQIDEATKESFLELKLRVKLEWDDHRLFSNAMNPCCGVLPFMLSLTVSWFKMPPALSDGTAPSDSLDHLEAQAAPTHPRAPAEDRGSSPWSQ